MIVPRSSLRVWDWDERGKAGLPGGASETGKKCSLWETMGSIFCVIKMREGKEKGPAPGNEIGQMGCHKLRYMAMERRMEHLEDQQPKPMGPYAMGTFCDAKMDAGLPVPEDMGACLDKTQDPYYFLCGKTPVSLCFVNEDRQLWEALVSYFRVLKERKV